MTIHKLFLTFDVEDFVNVRSIEALFLILRLLKKYHVRALFFITGHVAERLSSFPQVLDLLGNHEIGYHSSSHSVRPNIFEYTDLESYQDAYLISLRRETSHINPLSGEIEGEGGIKTLRKLFCQKEIEAFRAPGFSWSPPHLEALRSLGFEYDFSTDLSNVPVFHKGTTFFPFPVLIDWKDSFNYYKDFFWFVLSREVSVLDFHPDLFVNQSYWDSFFPRNAPQKGRRQAMLLLLKLEFLLKTIQFLKKAKFVEITPKPNEAKIRLDTTRIDVENVLKRIFVAPVTQFNYRPKFLRRHILQFFDILPTMH
ncbi:MAG: polysaccharide deacetylase family protein [Candidatus Bathyarchaeota archaeon]|nr:polysaccharide deacetylase family protein [Candidatus Bathyarchaeota archaeon]